LLATPDLTLIKFGLIPFIFTGKHILPRLDDRFFEDLQTLTSGAISQKFKINVIQKIKERYQLFPLLIASSLEENHLPGL